MKRVVNTLGKLHWANKAYVVLVLLATAIALPALTFTTLHSFDGADGRNPNAGLIQATNGDLYGTAFQGGANKQGTVFKITPSGTLTRLHSFAGADGQNPPAGLIGGTHFA
jgi:uncharacterized repeat protein (TIGR03803 family)